MPYDGRVTGMKRIRICGLVICLSVLGTPAQAGDAKFSLLRCGLQWGGSSTQPSAYTAAKKKQKYDTLRSLDSFYSNRPVAHSFDTTSSEKNGRGRLPRTITLAKVGCSWR